MTQDAWHLIALLVCFAALVAVHVFVVVRVLTSAATTRAMRWLVLVPPAAPWVAWRAGYRVPAVVWGALLVGYAVLRIAG